MCPLMKKTFYYCDLCGLESKDPHNELIGFEFDHKDGLRKAFYNACERHYCKKCCESLYQFLVSIRTKS